MASFTELETWKQARKIRINASRLAKSFPQEEKFRLGDQLVRCSRSIGNNIAEGHGRFHYQDNVRFCVIARGSLSETLDQMIIAKDENLITDDVFNAFQADYDQCMKLLNGYILFIKKKKNNELD
ncbi:four helix bundle protein [Mucilaginibacter ginsenosidivorans]|uniref:Four helix bundle protein n=1 Tax=Mucilaginibacter ginsenosidivorans TaxID=398053 RepID=A0A5B8UYV2_9SPHI|nr:four helix bundle protein [Mucilaginibacter ginsenosidivorans]QEC64320.1 four helix bundle protein [Mucilaginibacter ginsenosidivorans]